MATNKTIADYGGIFANAKPVEDPTTQPDAALYNRMSEDVAQMTRVASKVILHFPTVASGNSTPTYCETQWGTGPSFYPTTVTRTGTGAYTITFPSSFADGLSVSESVTFQGGSGVILSTSVFGCVFFTCSANVITLVTTNMAGTATDLTAGTIVRIEAR